MSFYKKLADWASGMEQRKIERKAIRFKQPVSMLEFHNTISSLFGDFCQVTEHNCTLLIARTNDMLTNIVKVLDTRFSDWGCVIRDMLVDIKGQIVDQLFITADDIDHKAGKRHNVVVNYIFGLFEHQKTMDLNESNRYLELMERIRIQDLRLEEYMNICLNTQVGLFEKITEVFGYSNSGPTLDWVIDNADELMRFSMAMKNIRENNVPSNIGVNEAAKCLRTMLNVDTAEVIAALDAKTAQWASAA